jgi:hypothetical protein
LLILFLCQVSAKLTVKLHNIAINNINKGVGIKAINLKECDMVSENYTIKMVATIKVNGNKIKWMVSLNSTTKMVRSPTRATGKTTNSMVEAKSSMIIHKN